MTKTRIPLILLFLLSACTGNYTWDTNLDSNKIAEYFKPAKVRMVTRASQEAKLLGTLSAERCDITQPNSDNIFVELRTSLRGKAADLGANQLVVEKCSTEQAKDITSCPFKSSCSGQAYLDKDI